MQGNRDLLGLESHPRASRPRGLLILSMGEGVRHLVPQSAKEAHSRRGEATKGLEEKRNDGVALAEGISVVGRRGGDVAGVLTRVESPLVLVAAGCAFKDLLLGQLLRVLPKPTRAPARPMEVITDESGSRNFRSARRW